jgi:hypothetical protein
MNLSYVLSSFRLFGIGWLCAGDAWNYRDYEQAHRECYDRVCAVIAAENRRIVHRQIVAAAAATAAAAGSSNSVATVANGSGPAAPISASSSTSSTGASNDVTAAAAAATAAVVVATPASSSDNAALASDAATTQTTAATVGAAPQAVAVAATAAVQPVAQLDVMQWHKDAPFLTCCCFQGHERMYSLRLAVRAPDSNSAIAVNNATVPSAVPSVVATAPVVANANSISASPVPIFIDLTSSPREAPEVSPQIGCEAIVMSPAVVYATPTVCCVDNANASATATATASSVSAVEQDNRIAA